MVMNMMEICISLSNNMRKLGKYIRMYIHSLTECIKEQTESNSVKDEEGNIMKYEAIENMANQVLVKWWS